MHVFRLKHCMLRLYSLCFRFTWMEWSSRMFQRPVLSLFWCLQACCISSASRLLGTWNCSLLLNWCEAPCRIPAFLPSVCQMVSPRGQGGWLEPAKSHPRARAGGSTGKDIFWTVTRAARVLFRGRSFNIQKVVLQVFQQIHNVEKSLGWSQINI